MEEVDFILEVCEWEGGGRGGIEVRGEGRREGGGKEGGREGGRKRRRREREVRREGRREGRRERERRERERGREGKERGREKRKGVNACTEEGEQKLHIEMRLSVIFCIRYIAVGHPPISQSTTCS